MYNGIKVSYSQKYEHHAVVEDFYTATFQPFKMFRIIHTLEVQAPEMSATITCSTNDNYSVAVVVSCLLAGLKKIKNGVIYNQARKEVEYLMKFQVDTMIPGYIAEISGIEQGFSHVHYDISIVAFLHFSSIQKPMFEAIMHDDKYMIEMRLNYYAGVHKSYTSTLIDPEIYHDGGSQVIKEIYDRLWFDTYQKAPMLSPDLSFMRYSEGILNGGSYHQALYKNVSAKSTWLHEGLAENSAGRRDSRVDDLPGIHEMVNHPITKHRQSIEKIVISLNDYHKWTREEIADWLDTLDVDLTFKVKEDINEQD